MSDIARGIRVLLVEDDAEDAGLTRRLLCGLAGYDCAVDWVASFPAACEAISGSAYDILLLDYELGGHTGLELLGAASGPNSQTPAILLTGRGDDRGAEAVAAGVVAYLEKGQTTSTVLERVIRHAIDRRVRESTSAAARAFLQDTLDSLCEHVAMIDADGAVVAVNQSWERFATANEYQGPNRGVGSNYLTICDSASGPGSDEASDAARLIREILAGERQEGSVEYPCNSPTEERWFRMRVTRITARGPAAAVIAHEDITSLKQALFAERSARRDAERANAQMHVALDSVTDAFFVIDRNWRIRFVNAAGARLVRRPADALVGQNAWDVAPEAVGSIYYEQFHSVMRTGVTSHFKTNAGPRGLWMECDVYPSPEGITVYLRDCTEKHLADQAIGLQARLLDAVEQAVISTDVDGRITYWNRWAEALYGWSAAEALGADVRTLIGIDAEVQRAAHPLADLGSGAGTRLEHTLRRKDGSTFTALAISSPIRDASGAVVGRVGVSIDVSERVRADAEVRAREEQLNTMVTIQQEIATTGVGLEEVMRLVAERARELTKATGAAVELVDDEEMVFRAASGSTESQVGLRLPAATSLSGQCVRDGTVLYSEDTGMDPRVNQDAARQVGARSMIVAPLYHGAVPVGALKVISAMPNQFNPLDVRTIKLLAGLIGAAMGRDAELAARQAMIIERSAAVDTIRKQEQHFRSLIENASDPVVVADEAGTITYASPAFSRVLGYAPDRLTGTKIVELIHPDDLERTASALVRVLGATDSVVTFEVRARHSDGTWRTLMSTAKNLLADPTVNGVVVNLRDVTDQKMLAEQLRMAQRLESVGQLAAGVAHDFNNLLTVIALNGEFMADALDTGHPACEDLAQIRAAAERATGLTRQLLAFSRQQILQPKVLDMNAIVASITPMIRRLIGENIEVSLLPGVDDARVVADPGQLEQVLVNLAVNARDAMPDGGALTIETQLVDLEDDYVDRHEVVMPGKYVMLVVRDTGVGMDRATEARVFEPFFTTKEPGKGTGLGLATVYGIVKQSGGYIWVESRVGRGTTFRIYLPYAAAAVVTQEAAASRKAPRGTETVLLVEDEGAVRQLARRILERSGYVVLEASNGLEGAALSESHAGPIQLLLTDVVMPQMGGRDLAERLKQGRPRMQVLYMSGYTDDDILRRGFVDLHTAFIQKPFTADGLARMVRRTLDGTEMAGL